MEFYGLFKENIFKFRKSGYNVFPLATILKFLYICLVCVCGGGGTFYVLRPLNYLTCVTSYLVFSFLLSTYV